MMLLAQNTVELSMSITVALAGFALAFLVQFGAVVYFAATLRAEVKHIGETLMSWRTEFKEEREEIIKRVNRHSDDLRELNTDIAVIKSKLPNGDSGSSGNYRKE